MTTIRPPESALAIVALQPTTFAWVQRPPPALADDAVQIDVAWAGLNPSDVQFAQAAAAADLPLFLGGEVSGVVSAVGRSVSRVRVGDHVLAYLAQGRGGFAHQVRAREVFVARCPQGVSGAQAAGSVVAGLTALACVERVQDLSGRPVLVLGAAGGVGSMLVPLLRTAGACITATAGSDDSEQHLVSTLGLEPGQVMRRDRGAETRLLRDLASPACPPGFDVVFDLVGGATTALASRAVADRGTVVGIAGGPPDEASHEALFDRNARFDHVLLYADALRPVPSAWARYAPAMDALVDRLTRGDMRPAPVTVLGDLGPETAQEGLRRLASGRTRGKLVMRVTA